MSKTDLKPLILSILLFKLFMVLRAMVPNKKLIYFHKRFSLLCDGHASAGGEGKGHHQLWIISKFCLVLNDASALVGHKRQTILN